MTPTRYRPLRWWISSVLASVTMLACGGGEGDAGSPKCATTPDVDPSLAGSACRAGSGIASGDIALRDLRDVNALKGCTAVQGNLSVNNSCLTNLEGLESLTSIGGSLWIDGNDVLENLNGLETVTSTKFIVIQGNPALTSLAALSHVTSSIEITVADNAKLVSLEGLGAITSLSDLFVQGNAALTELASFSGLTQLFSLYIENNRALESLGGLEAVTSVGRLHLTNNDAMRNLDGLSGLTAVNGYVTIVGNDALTSIQGLASAQMVPAGRTSRINLSAHPKLTNLQGLEKLTNVAQLEVLALNGNTALTSLAGLSPTLIAVDRLEVSETGMTDLVGLDNIASIGGLYLHGNKGLTSLNGMSPQLTELSSLEVVGNPLLAALDALSNVLTIESVLRIEDNDALGDLDGLDGVIGGGSISLHVNGNGALTRLAALEAIESAEILEIRDNDQLASLDGLGNLAKVTGTVLDISTDETMDVGLTIEGNAALRSLAGLGALTSVGHAFEVYDNPRLPACEARALAMRTEIDCSRCSGNDGDSSCP